MARGDRQPLPDGDAMLTSARRPDRETATGPPRALRIGCVYGREDASRLVVASMSHIRFFRMAEALARRGHEVDIILNRRATPMRLGARCREVPFRHVDWRRYDVIKTFFHRGFDALLAEGGGEHPFIVSKLGSVVGREQTPGVHFYGAVRERLFETQERIAATSRAVTVLTRQSADLWRDTHGPGTQLLEVPTGVDARIPPPGANPYAALGIREPVALYAGNLYSSMQQPEVNALWQDRLIRLGFALRRRGLRFVAMGPGETDRLDPRAVTHVGPIDHVRFWDWQRHARVGIVLAQGRMQDNESSKIYYYLRTALPIVCERPVPNARLVTETRHGFLVDYDDVTALAEAAAWLAASPPDPDGLVDHVIRRHSWDARAALYDPVLAVVPRRASC
jgi:hypothetical protein